MRSFVVCFLCVAPAAVALSPAVGVHELLHDSWTEGGGDSIGNVAALVQGRTGYLWLGMPNLLLRFDGLQFSRPHGFVPQDGAAGSGCLGLSRDGAIWAARKDTVLRFEGGAIETFSTSGVRQIVEDASGDMWFLQADGLSRLTPKTRVPRRYTTADGLPGTVERIAAGAGGGLWLGVPGAVCRWAPGTPATCHSAPGLFRALAVVGRDEVYAASSAAVVRIAGGTTETLTSDLRNATVWLGAIVVDRDRNVWVGTTAGLLRLRGRVTEWLTRKDGLSGDTVSALTEDTEGDIWVGTGNGLDRLRNPRVLHFSHADGLSGGFVTAVAAAADGAVWVGTGGSGLNRWENGHVTVFGPAEGLPGKFVFSLHVDRRGALWVAADHGIARLEDRRLRPASTGGAAADQTFAIADDAAGAIWIADQKSGVWRLYGGRASHVEPAPFEGIFRLAGAPDGSMWLGSYLHGVARLRGNQAPVIEAHLGPDPPRAMIVDDAGALWVGAGHVLARIRNGKVTQWRSREGLPPDEIQGIVDDRRGSLWLLTAETVARISRAQLDSSPDGAASPITIARYDKRDGLRLKAVGGMPSPRIAAAADGRIWVPEQDGVAILDPELLKPDTVPPPVQIEHFTVDGAVLPRTSRRFRGHETRIAYAGLSLRAPERVRFRYRIDPGGGTWTEADGRHEVTFVNLPPDRYRFHVTACNMDNLCNPDGAAVEFDVVPYFYQTIWAKLLLILMAGALGWSTYRLRLRQMQARFRLAAQERARVTREIHDTLLQGFAGVVYQLEAASRQFESQPTASKERLTRAISQADDALTEARKMLQDMRLPVLEASTLPEALQEAGANAAAGGSADFSLRTKGHIAPLPYAAQAAMFLIGREAVNNAVNHANASRIMVHLNYAEREFRMIIHDDGAGFDPEAGKERQGHFGLASMGERARQVGADFRIESAPGKGTVVTVTIGRK